MGELVIRPAQLTDLIELRQLYARMMTERPQLYPIIDQDALTDFTTDMARQLATRDPALFVQLALLDHVAVGFCLAAVQTRVIGTPHVFALIHYYYVAPDARSHSIGRKMAIALLEDLVSKGVPAIEIGSLPGDDQWTRRGFLPVAVIHAAPTQLALQMANASLARVPDPSAVYGPTESNGHASDEPEVS